eukprot:scaffold9733_cov108-Isochrysis_galbana.AAC.6
MLLFGGGDARRSAGDGTTEREVGHVRLYERRPMDDRFNYFGLRCARMWEAGRERRMFALTLW